MHKGPWIYFINNEEFIVTSYDKTSKNVSFIITKVFPEKSIERYKNLQTSEVYHLAFSEKYYIDYADYKELIKQILILTKL